MSNPVRLDQKQEVARFDPTRLEQMCLEKGEAEAEAEAADALNLIGQLLREIAPGDDHITDAQLAAQVAALKTASDRIGMSTLSRVSGDVAYCLNRGDPVALAATLARLFRVGDRSIHAIFDLDDQQI